MPIDISGTAVVPTGFPALDTALGGGWPMGLLTELLVEGGGSGELGLLSPALARLTSGEPGWIMLIAPPWIPYAPGLCWQGLGIARVLVTRVRQPPEALWAMEEALGSGACAGVIAWAGIASRAALQRLHLRAVRRRAWAVLIRAARFRRERSPAVLRLQLWPGPQPQLRVEIFKNRLRGAALVTLP